MSKINISISIEDVDAGTIEVLETLLENLKSESADKPEVKAPRKRAPKKEIVEVEEKPEVIKENPKKEEKQTTSEIKIEDVRALLAVKVGDNRDAIKAKLTELKAKNVTTLKEEHYEAFSAFLTDL